LLLPLDNGKCPGGVWTDGIDLFVTLSIIPKFGMPPFLGQGKEFSIIIFISFLFPVDMRIWKGTFTSNIP